MTIGARLKQEAMKIFEGLRDRKAKLQSEYDDLQMQVSQKKAELDAHVDALSQSHERLLNYNPGPVGKLLCPRCWVVNGREHPVSIDPSPGRDDVLRCNACHQKFSVE